MTIALEDIRDCLEGAIPAVMATCARDGTPNVAYLSQVQFIDAEHVALSFQFFNKTRRNVLENPQATLLLVHPHTGAMYRLALHYLRTETEGPLFESMKAKLAAIASQTGMSDIFKLLGSDVYRVAQVEAVPQRRAAPAPCAPNRLPALRRLSESLNACADLGTLLDAALAGLEREFDVGHAVILMADAGRRRLFTLASRGYADSGVGSEIAFGHGVIGVAARERTPIRLSHATAEYAYSRAIRHSVEQEGLSDRLETEIPLPGLAGSRSQLAVPVLAHGRLLGVLYLESPQDMRFDYDCEDALVAFAAQLGWAMAHLQAAGDVEDASPESVAAPADDGEPLTVKHYAADHSVFLDGDYLIKGVAGAILWRLLTEYAISGRSAFSNRELRLDPALCLPEISDNLEARLVLLQRRLDERGARIRLVKTGRGRFCLSVNGRLERIEA